MSSSATALEVSIPQTTIIAGETTKIPLIIDKTDNLAGVRLVLSYDSKDFAYVGAVKTKKTAQMMHMVNDKKTGELIIAMAGAQGIKGEKISILDLSFKAGQVKEKKTSTMEIREVQLMNDQMKNIECAIRVNPVTILPIVSGER